jgi:hypothetical protein
MYLHPNSPPLANCNEYNTLHQVSVLSHPIAHWFPLYECLWTTGNRSDFPSLHLSRGFLLHRMVFGSEQVCVLRFLHLTLSRCSFLHTYIMIASQPIPHYRSTSSSIPTVGLLKCLTRVIKHAYPELGLLVRTSTSWATSGQITVTEHLPMS